jgi:hypothetical protein
MRLGLFLLGALIVLAIRKRDRHVTGPWWV